MRKLGNRWLIAILLFGVVLAAAELFIITLTVLLTAFAGILFGVFVCGITRWITRHTPLSYRWAYVIFVTIMLLSAAAGAYYLGVRVVDQASQLWAELRTAAEGAVAKVQEIGWIDKFMPADMENASGAAKQVMPNALAALSWLGWGVTGIFVIFFTGLYAAWHPSLYVAGVVKLFPLDRRERIREVLGTLRSALSWWIVGRMVSMGIIGVLTALGLWLLGVPLPLTLGVLAAILTFIPNIGPILATVPQAMLALQVSEKMVLYVILFNIVLQGVESYIVTPIIQRYEVSLPPVLTVVVQLLMGALFGVIGLLMAAPLTVTATVLIQLLYIRDILGDQSPGSLTENI